MAPKIAESLALLIERVDDLIAKVDILFQRDYKSMLDSLSASLCDITSTVQE